MTAIEIDYEPVRISLAEKQKAYLGRIRKGLRVILKGIRLKKGQREHLAKAIWKTFCHLANCHMPQTYDFYIAMDVVTRDLALDEGQSSSYPIELVLAMTVTEDGAEKTRLLIMRVGNGDISYEQA